MGDHGEVGAVENRVVRVSRARSSTAELPDHLRRISDAVVLRWFVADVTDEEYIVELTTVFSASDSHQMDAGFDAGQGESLIVNLVPTGIGCSIGGFAGDAAPANALLAATCDHVIVNPNAVNASNFVNLPHNAFYTEGFMIDQWMLGAARLFRPRGNRIGLIVERSDDESLATVYRIVDTARAVYGVDVVAIVVSDEPIGTSSVINPSGAYVGTVTNPSELLRCARALIDRGATAIAVTSNIMGLDSSEYTAHFEGRAPNPVGGAEAVVSHLVVHTFGVPCAHAPLVNYKECAVTGEADPRAAGELASDSGLACVLIGLRQAPHLRPDLGGAPISLADVRAVVAPATALGGPSVIAAERRGIPVIGVRENSTVLKATADALGLEGVVDSGSYFEAAGVAVALINDIALSSIRRPIPTARELTRR
jgi:hypothetical protein